MTTENTLPESSLEPCSKGVYVETRPPVARIITGVVATIVAVLTMTGILGPEAGATLQDTLVNVALLLIGAYETISGSVRAAALKSSKVKGDPGATDVVVAKKA